MTELVNSEQDLDPTPVRRLMGLMVKCQRAMVLYMPNNPVYQEAAGDLQQALKELWTDTQELLLRVKDDGFTWRGHVVLQDRDKADSMAWTLFKDGTVAVRMTPGAEEEEVLRFLHAIHTAQTLPDDADDDARTLLWAEDFKTIKCDYTQLGVEGTARPLEPSEFGGVPHSPMTVRRELERDIQFPEGIVNIDDVDSTLYFLDEDEIQYLNREIEREYKKDLRGNVLSMFFDALELEAEETGHDEIVAILEEFLMYLLGAGDPRSMAYILREARVVERSEQLGAVYRDRLATFAAKLSEPGTLEQLLKTLDESDDVPDDEDLAELFGGLQPHAMETVLSWLPRLGSERARRVLARATDQLGTEHPDAVSQALASEDRTVVIGALRLVSSLSLSVAGSALEKLTSDPEKAVREALVDALAALATPSAIVQLEELLGDKERDVRIRAVNELSNRRDEGALSRVEAAVLGKAIRLADLTEKRAFFEAYGFLSGEAGVAPMRSLLLRRFFRPKADPGTRACAAMALGKIANDAATKVLKKVEKDREPVVRTAVHHALEEIAS